jgi:hypothetical protein
MIDRAIDRRATRTLLTGPLASSYQAEADFRKSEGVRNVAARECFEA